MQRWWFLDDKVKPSTKTSEYSIPDKPTDVVERERKWTFRVLVNQPVQCFEKLAVSGDCKILGEWLPDHCCIMTREENSNVWSCEVSIPVEKSVDYRYFICTSDPQTEHVHIRRWETHLKPREVPIYEEQIPLGNIDTFGELNGIEKIDAGWLTTETIIQFKFFNNPFHLKHKLKHRLLYVKLTPLNLKSSEASSMSTSFDESLSSDTRENGTEQPAYAFAEVVTLKYPTSSIEIQPQFGRAYYQDEFLIFNVTVAEPDNVAYLIDLYTYSSRVAPDEPPYHLGYHYILPNLLRKSDGELEIPITCASKHRPLGMMNVEYLKITPLQSHQMRMRESYIRYWNRKWTGLDVGHRGLGPSFKPSKVPEGHSIRENTIASLKQAAEYGADMVEFDVQLSKDLVPVIYHDFQVCVSLKKKSSFESNDMLELPMKELTLEQLKNLKVYHVVEGRNREPKFFDEHLDEHQPFPKLADALESIDMSVGFNIEVKWSMQLKDGTRELETIIDRNLYVDCILNVVFAKASTRRIVFSCFDPDICTMLRYKQNVYPVMFLTIGVTDRYPMYHDPRCNTTENAVSYAYAMELLGIVAHTEDLLRDQTRIKIATDLGLIVFCWGDDNNSQDTIRLLKSLGIHGVIYDKMDVLSTKEVKKSIFLIEAKESQKDILRIQQLEYKKHSIERPASNKELLSFVENSDDILAIQDVRDRVALSTASSLESVLTND